MYKYTIYAIQSWNRWWWKRWHILEHHRATGHHIRSFAAGPWSRTWRKRRKDALSDLLSSVQQDPSLMGNSLGEEDIGTLTDGLFDEWMSVNVSERASGFGPGAQLTQSSCSVMSTWLRRLYLDYIRLHPHQCNSLRSARGILSRCASAVNAWQTKSWGLDQKQWREKRWFSRCLRLHSTCSHYISLPALCHFGGSLGSQKQHTLELYLSCSMSPLWVVGRDVQARFDE